MKFLFRHLWHHRLYSSIKIAGLSIGMACALLAILFVKDENSYDRFHQKASQLFRVTTTITNLQNGESRIGGATGQVQGPAFKSNIPQIQESVRIWPALSTNFIGDQKSLRVNYIYADDGFFKVFTFPLLYGNPSTALSELNSVVVSEQTALRFFGRTDVVGKTIKLEEGKGMVTFLITGVAKTIPFNSSIQFEAVLPFSYLQTMFDDRDWLNSYLSTFVLLHPQADANGVKNKFAQIFRNEARAQLREAKMVPYQIEYGLQPITGIHLNIFEKGASADKGSGNLAESSIATYSWLLMGIAGFILMMAIVNFLNLSIAGSLKRSKEIGVRKISGGTVGQIIRQFLTEASVLCCTSLILAILLVTGTLPVFNQLAQKHISYSFLANSVFFLYALLLMGICIITVGMYPAIKLSLLNATDVLYNRQKLRGKNYFTKSLIVLQFTLAVILLIATIIYYRQMNFITKKDLGYDVTDIVGIKMPPYRQVNQQTTNFLRTELAKESSIIQISYGGMIPGDETMIKLNGSEIIAGRSNIDPFFLPTFDLHLKEGRNFSTHLANDSGSVIVNETFVKSIGWKDPVDKTITITDGLSNKQPKTIIGVVKDYHYSSLKEKIRPQILELGPSSQMWLKLRAGQFPRALSALERVFKRAFPEYYYQYAFMDDEKKELYANEQRWKQIISYAAALAIIICCIGLFGLAHFATLKRTKEIGIRKVLGASAVNISRLLSKDFLQLVLLAIIIAWPVSSYVMTNWLQNFSYRIRISWLDFLLAALIALVIALITVGSQTFRSAMANPVKSLRIE